MRSFRLASQIGRTDDHERGGAIIVSTEVASVALCACVAADPALAEASAHFGFMLDNRAELDRWKTYYEGQGIAVDAQRNGNAIFVTDPERNSFEMFFGPSRFVAQS